MLLRSPLFFYSARRELTEARSVNGSDYEVMNVFSTDSQRWNYKMKVKERLESKELSQLRGKVKFERFKH